MRGQGMVDCALRNSVDGGEMTNTDYVVVLICAGVGVCAWAWGMVRVSQIRDKRERAEIRRWLREREIK